MDLLGEMSLSDVTGLPIGRTTVEINELWHCRAIGAGILPPETEQQHAIAYLFILCDMLLGFGIGVYPRHSAEYVLAFISVVLNMVMNTFFLGVVATAMSQADPLKREFNERMDHLRVLLLVHW